MNTIKSKKYLLGRIHPLFDNQPLFNNRPLFPTVLKQLIFNYLYLDDIPKKYYSLLLEVYYNKKIMEDNDLKLLLNCRKLYLKLNGYLIESCIKYLPKNLIYLNLSRSDKTLNIHYSPKSLHSYLWHNISLNDSCIKYLPKNLTHLDLTVNNIYLDEIFVKYIFNNVTHFYFNKKKIERVLPNCKLY